MALNRWVFSLKGVVQNYSWGGFDFLPSLLDIPNAEKRPYAEYWMGAHPNHSSTIIEEEDSLLHIIENKKSEWLGDKLASKFGSLPFLLKLLDVRQMLSIQVHPALVSAKIGFEEENNKSIPLNAPHRNYKDPNHKPELMVALGDFWLLHGFKNEKELNAILERTVELNFLQPIFRQGSYKKLYEEVMLMEQDQVDAVLDKLNKRILPLYQQGSLSRDQEDFWAARAILNFCAGGKYDRGIFSIYLFNLLHLKKGEGIYQPAGLPHAYLEGQNVEVMANSDNVLRAGLTDKHIDVNELMKHVVFEPTIPAIIRNEGGQHMVYRSEAREFELHSYEMRSQSETMQTNSPEIFLVMEGAVEIQGARSLLGEKGDAFYILPGHKIGLKPMEPALVFRVCVPSVEN